MSDPLEAIMTVASASGGAGRSTLAASIAAARLQEEVEVLVVDLDPVGGLSYLMAESPSVGPKGILAALDEMDRPESYVRETICDGLSILVSDFSASSSDIVLRDAFRYNLSHLLHALRRRYRTIVLDVPAGTGLFARGAFEASDAVLVVQPIEPLAVRQLPNLLAGIQQSRIDGNSEPYLAGVCLNKVDTETPFFSNVYNELTSSFDGLLLETAVPSDPWFLEAAARMWPLPLLFPDAPGAIAVTRLLEEIRVRLS